MTAITIIAVVTIRIHFTAEDLARTRLAPGPGPLVELHAALRVLQNSASPVRFDAWRRRAFTHLRPQVRMLFDLVPAGDWGVAFLIQPEAGVAEDLFDALRHTPTSYLRSDMAQWAELRQRIPSWTHRLGREPELFQHVTTVLKHAHDQLIAPFWLQIAGLAQADRALRIQHLADDGVEGLLNRLDPRHIRWRPPLLELRTATSRSSDIHLGGRGLLLIPTLFGTRYPILDICAEPLPWLTFPVRQDKHEITTRPVVTAAALTTAPQSLVALLGRTRATVLCAIADHPGCTTTELARHSGIAPASASEHATILRNAGLATTSRYRNRALHSPTPAAINLLNTSTGSTQEHAR